MHVSGDPRTQIITVEAPRTLTVLNFSAQAQLWSPPAGWQPLVASVAARGEGRLEPYAAIVLKR